MIAGLKSIVVGGGGGGVIRVGCKFNGGTSIFNLCKTIKSTVVFGALRRPGARYRRPVDWIVESDRFTVSKRTVELSAFDMTHIPWQPVTAVGFKSFSRKDRSGLNEVNRVTFAGVVVPDHRNRNTVGVFSCSDRHVVTRVTRFHTERQSKSVFTFYSFHSACAWRARRETNARDEQTSQLREGRSGLVRETSKPGELCISRVYGMLTVSSMAVLLDLFCYRAP